jgi:hypothetical protein
MSDEKPVPETLETIAASIRELRQSMESRFSEVDTRFDAVDARFDKVERRITTEIADAKAQLGVKIEAVHAEVKLVYDEAIAQRAKHTANDADHERFREDLTNHDLRLRALASRKNGQT